MLAKIYRCWHVVRLGAVLGVPPVGGADLAARARCQPTAVDLDLHTSLRGLFILLTHPKLRRPAGPRRFVAHVSIEQARLNNVVVDAGRPRPTDTYDP